MKALKSALAARMQAAGVRIPQDGSPFEFEGVTYRAVTVPAPQPAPQQMGIEA